MNKQSNKTRVSRKTRGDVLIKNIEKKYDINFGVRGDMKLGTYLKNKGIPSLAKAIETASKMST